MRIWQRARRLFGVSGMLGALMLVLALAFLAAETELKRASEETKAELEQRRATVGRTRDAVPVTLTAQEQLDHFVDGFPPIAQNASDMKAVFAGAQRAQVTLPKGDYAMKADAGSPFITYTATFPVRESYAALKLFAAEVLQDLPHAALDELRMVRPDASSPVLDATVRFTFVYRRP